jgi:hypothetical protein
MEPQAMTSNFATLKIAGAPALSRAEPSLASLRAWQRTGAVLSFLYARSLGGLMQAGHGRIASLSDTALTVDTGGTSLFVVLTNARYDDSPQMFFTPTLSGQFMVPGVGISLGNHDWLFFSADQVPKEAMLSLEHLPKIR